MIMPFWRGERAARTGVLALFVLSAFLQLLPLSLHPGDSLNDGWDCLLNTWILGWDRQQLARDPVRLFEANVFFPHRGTLSYSESLLPLAILAWPVAALTGNPILAYNFVFFLSCVLNAYAMFLLVRHLTGSLLSGAAAGLIFAFSATLMQQITHLQLVAAWFLPLALLSLHRFFETGRARYSVMFSLALVLQALTCVYYGLFLLSLLPLLLTVMLLLYRKSLKPAVWLKLGLPLLGAGLALAAYAVPYLRLFRAFQFQRSLENGAELQNYLSVPPHNKLWGSLLHPLGSYEYFFFPGAVALALAGGYLIWRFLKSRRFSRPLKSVTLALLAVPALLTLYALIFHGFKVRFGAVNLSLTNPAKQAFVFLTGLGLALALGFVLYLFRSGDDGPERGLPFLYLFLAFSSLMFSFGASFALQGSRVYSHLAPFAWLYKNIPGFKGVRVPSRYAVFVILGLAVLAGYGLSQLSRRLAKRGRRAALAAIVLVLVNAESWSFPQRLLRFPVGNDIPPTYRWLAERPGDFALVELPSPGGVQNEAVYMYFSLFHRKKIVNGYSGFLPPTVDPLRSLLRDFPQQASLEALQALGVKYVVFHAKRLPSDRAEDIRFDARHRSAHLLREAASFRYGFRRPNDLEDWLGDDTIYEVLPPEAPIPRPLPDVEIPATGWRAGSSLNPGLLDAIKDGDRRTAWTTGHPKTRGESLLIAFPEPIRVSRISLDAGPATSNAAGNLVAWRSLDGRDWGLASPGFHAGAFLRSLIDDPTRAVQEILLRGEETRFIKIEQTGLDPLWPWAVAELKLFRPAKTP